MSVYLLKIIIDAHVWISYTDKNPKIEMFTFYVIYTLQNVRQNVSKLLNIIY